MAVNNWSQLKSDIAQYIKNNTEESITGDVLQSNLFSMIDNIGQGAIYSGTVLPASTPHPTDGVVFYLASQPGTYTNFSGVTIVNEGIYVISNRVDVGDWVIDNVLDLSGFEARLAGASPSKSEVWFDGGGLKITPRRVLFNPTGWTLELSMYSYDSNSGSLFITQDVGGVNLVFNSGKLVLSQGAVGDILEFNVATDSDDVYGIVDTGSSYAVYKNGDPYAFTLLNNYRTTSIFINDWYVGAFEYLSQPTDIRLNTLRIWSIVQDATAMKSLYNGGYPGNRRYVKRDEITMELIADNATETNWYDTSMYRNKGLIKGDVKMFTIKPNEIIGKDMTNLSIIPDNLYIVENRELNLYFESIFPFYKKGHYRVDCICQVGRTTERSFRYIPSGIETNTLTINVYDLDNSLLATRNITLEGIANNSGTGTQQILCIGDSTIDSYLTDYLPGTGRTPYEMLHEISDMFIADGGAQPLFLGTNGVDPYKHDARSGYSSDLFISNDPTYPNPFWDSTLNRNNFKKYMADNSNFGGADRIDYVPIQLGINDLKNTESNIYSNTVVGRLTSLINTIHDATYGYPDAWVIISLTPYVGNDKSGWSNAFKSISSYEKYCDNMTNLAAQLAEKFWLNPDFPKVFVCPTLLFVDRYYGYPRGSYNASARDAELETIFTDSVHPDKSGYFQAADAIYSTLRALMRT